MPHRQSTPPGGYRVPDPPAQPPSDQPGSRTHPRLVTDDEHHHTTHAEVNVRGSMGLTGIWNQIGNASAMMIVAVLVFMLLSDVKDARREFRADADKAHEGFRSVADKAHDRANANTQKLNDTLAAINVNTQKQTSELETMRRSMERTERIMSGAEVPWWVQLWQGIKKPTPTPEAPPPTPVPQETKKMGTGELRTDSDDNPFWMPRRR